VFKDFVVSLIVAKKGEFNPREDGIKLGIAKKNAVQAIYSGELTNNVGSIKKFLMNTENEWL